MKKYILMFFVFALLFQPKAETLAKIESATLQGHNFLIIAIAPCPSTILYYKIAETRTTVRIYVYENTIARGGECQSMRTQIIVPLSKSQLLKKISIMNPLWIPQ